MDKQEMTTILITGATGNVGGQVAQRLLDAGARVRVGVRDPSSDNAASWENAGAEVVHYDYDEPTIIRAALKGIDRLFLMTPMVEDPLTPNCAAVEAACDAGVSFVAKLSAIGSDPEAPPSPACLYGQVETMIKESSLEWTMLQPTFFMSNLVTHAAETIRSHNAFFGASGGGATAYISPGDIPHVAAVVLSDPTLHKGKSYVLTGQKAHTEKEVASIMSGATGRQITYHDVRVEGLRAGMAESGAAERMIDAMVYFESIKSNGWAADVSPSVEIVTGRKAETFEEFAHRHAISWKQ